MFGNSESRKLTKLILVCGLAAQALRWGLYASGVDGKGLLIRNQPLGIALAVLTVGVLLRIGLAAWKWEKKGELYSASLAAALGNVAAGAGILATALAEPPLASGYLADIWHFLGFAAPVCLLLAGLARAFGKKPFFLLHAVACLFYLMCIVNRYQLWSGNPQMQDYVFSLLGAISLSLFGFYTAALEAGCGKARMRLGVGLAAMYLCTAELARSACPWLYLGGIYWVLTELACTRYVCETE